MSSVSVRVPGSTSNCGAGFDTLGLALCVYNTVTLTEGSMEGAQPVRPSDGQAAELVGQVVEEMKQAEISIPAGFSYRIDGDVPTSRGLGSSVTVLAGVLAGLNELAGGPLDLLAQVKVLTRIEGHPDNAVAGVLGGFCVTRCGATAADYVDHVRREIPASLKFVVVSPKIEIATKGSRGILPGDIRHGDAVRSINSVSFLTAAIIAGEWDKLRGAAEDFIHEPFRLPTIPGAAEAIRAGLEAGALTGWLSGSGSSVLCVADADHAEAVARVMSESFADAGAPAVSRILVTDNRGLVVQ